jgi:hypothetical protein
MNNFILTADYVFAMIPSNDNQRTDNQSHYGQAGLIHKASLGASLRWFRESRAA